MHPIMLFLATKVLTKVSICQRLHTSFAFFCPTPSKNAAIAPKRPHPSTLTGTKAYALSPASSA